jgi:deoxyadenosine/deoxycytidine kinase
MFKNGQFLVVEGNIGAGKTSLCQMLARDWNARLILEEFSDNPFLPLFYAQPDRYAFPVELFFMTERHKQLQALLLEQDLFQQYTVSDYVFSKTLLFAGENLQGEELRLFQRLFETLNASFPKPDLLLYLHRDVHHLSANIRKRNRSYEQDLQEAYLLRIQEAYFRFFRHRPDLPIVLADLGDADFLEDPSVYAWLQSLLDRQWAPGFWRVERGS